MTPSRTADHPDITTPNATAPGATAWAAPGVERPVADPASRLGQTVGFPRSADARSLPRPGMTGTSNPSPAKPAGSSGPPSPKRPKGRWFISMIIAGLSLTVAGGLWNEFFRFEGHGYMEGRVIRVTPAWSGIIQGCFVTEGEFVRQGQLLATLDNVEQRLRREELADHIRVAQAGIAARWAELKASDWDRAERMLRLHVEYFELLGRYHQEQSRLDDLSRSLERLRVLTPSGAVAESQWDTTRFSLDGQQARVREMEAAVNRLRAGLESPELAGEAAGELGTSLHLERVRLESLLAEWRRLGEYGQLGQLRSPVHGRVVQRHGFAGEHLAAGTPLFELLEEDSLEGVVYLRPRRAAQLKPGDIVRLSAHGGRQAEPFRVQRLATHAGPAPSGAARYYRSGEQLVAVHARALLMSTGTQLAEAGFRLGAEIRWPRLANLPRRIVFRPAFSFAQWLPSPAPPAVSAQAAAFLRRRTEELADAHPVY